MPVSTLSRGRRRSRTPPWARASALLTDLPSCGRNWLQQSQPRTVPMSAPTFETITYAVEDGVATVTLNRPEKLNAFNTRMMRDLIDVFDVTDGDDAVRAVIVTGAGRAFCAGADLVSREDAGGLGSRPCSSPWTSGWRRPRRATASSSPAGASIPRRRRAGSCRTSSGSRRRWSGATPAASSPPPRPTSAGWSDRSTPRRTCCPRRARSPARSPTTPRRSRWR